MKKFISFFIFVAVFFTACGNSIKSNENISNEKSSKGEDKILLANSLWVENSDYMPFLIDALQRNDNEYLEQLMIEKKVFAVNKNTRVKSLGNTSDKNVELISFKEGRYTNKSGATFKKFLLLEEEYKQREKNSHEEAVNLIKQYFDETSNYESVLESLDYNYVNQFKQTCLDKCKHLENLSFQRKYNNEIKDMLNKASKIIGERENTIFYDLKVLENSQKYSQSQEASAERFMYKKLIQDFQKMVEESIQKEKQLRQEFLNTYGF